MIFKFKSTIFMMFYKWLEIGWNIACALDETSYLQYSWMNCLAFCFSSLVMTWGFVTCWRRRPRTPQQQSHSEWRRLVTLSYWTSQGDHCLPEGNIRAGRGGEGGRVTPFQVNFPLAGQRRAGSSQRGSDGVSCGVGGGRTGRRR